MDLRAAPSALEAVERAAIDIQIATAKRYPRSIERFIREARTMVSLDREVAEKCTYALKRREADGTFKIISGPSVRLAEIVACSWGNLRVQGRIIGDDGAFVTAQGVAMDMERNLGYSMEVKRRVTTAKGKRFGDDMIAVTCNAAIAIVTRNATFKAVPRAYVNLIHAEAQRVARGDTKLLSARLAAALEYFASKDVKEADVYRTLGVVGKADIGIEQLLVLNGFRVAIEDGDASAEEIFGGRTVEASASIAVPGETRTEGVTRKIQETVGEDTNVFRSEGGGAN